MTWGQLRLQLTIGAPGVSADLIDGWLNKRYARVLQASDWKGTEAHATIQSQAAYQSSADSVTLTVGSPAATGSLTSWTSAVTGQKFYRPGDQVIYTATYVSSTSLTLDRPYEGTGVDEPGTVYAGAQYALMQNVYQLPSDCSAVIGILNPVDGLPMDAMTKPELDRSVGPRTLVDNPGIYAIYDDTPETSPPVLHEVEFYPPPRYARGFVVNYWRAALAFDGGNTSGAPLTFVSDGVLLAGVRADIAKYLEKLPQAAVYEAEFKDELLAVLSVEHKQRRTKPTMRMAARFVRHRFARVDRGAVARFTGSEKPGV